MSFSYPELFARATGGERPFDWQVRFAAGADVPQVVRVPTGAGKTEGAWLGWLWRRRHADEAVRRSTPRRLVYCLPMRTLVEQTVERIVSQRDRLGAGDVAVHLLMGGAVARDWIDEPERDAVLVGTLDQLVSRALMRGYGESRFRWPIEFGLLHADALWVMDEVQLFGEALATSTQLEGLRRSFPEPPVPARTCWMSATVDPSWLGSVDHPAPTEVLELSEADRAGDLRPRLEATKRLARLPAIDADTVATAHRPGALTLVVVNTVPRAQALHGALSRRGVTPAELLLLHSRFRPPDRRRLTGALASPVPPDGRIVVATQVVEAGVDVSATTLITEAAPWASLVQRFGRCNRRGEIEDARVLWAPPERPDPYDAEEIEAAVVALERREGGSVGPAALEAEAEPLTAPPRRHVLRRPDLLGLFDTAPDISGLDLDVSRFVRDGDDMTASIAWRELGGGPPAADAPALTRDELCPASLAELRRGIDRAGASPVFRFDHLTEGWVRVAGRDIRPGDRLLTDLRFGCYSPERGFDRTMKGTVEPEGRETEVAPEGITADPLSEARGVWLTLAQHTDGVCDELETLLAAVAAPADPEVQGLRLAARLHDWGKSHPVFQRTMHAGDIPAALDGELLAKRQGAGPRHERPGFRHELASLLAYLDRDEADSLVAYLIAAHHGRVRLGARSLPGEGVLHEGRQVLGCREDDELPSADLGGGVVMPSSRLSLAHLDLGAEDGPTYTDRALEVLDRLGPFRLAYLEALLRTADRRRSAREARGEPDDA